MHTTGILYTRRVQRWLNLKKVPIWNLKNSDYFRDIWEKPNFLDFVFIFFWLYLKSYDKINFTFLLPYFLLYKPTFLDFQYDVSFFLNHHQLTFFKWSKKIVLSLESSNFNSKPHDISLLTFVILLSDDYYEGTKRCIRNVITLSSRGAKIT